MAHSGDLQLAGFCSAQVPDANCAVLGYGSLKENLISLINPMLLVVPLDMLDRACCTAPGIGRHLPPHRPADPGLTVSTLLRPDLGYPVAVQMVSIILNCSSLHAVSPGASVMSSTAHRL
jgi:hypothetical protein